MFQKILFIPQTLQTFVMPKLEDAIVLRQQIAVQVEMFARKMECAGVNIYEISIRNK